MYQALDYKNVRPLRIGYTTGSCAAAASEAAALMLLKGEVPQNILIRTPGGPEFEVRIEAAEFTESGAFCSVRKDSGDDPDITNGVMISADVQKAGAGIEIRAGTGVGKVTKPGLLRGVGEPAINPGPCRQITEAVTRVAKGQGYEGGFIVTISVEGGEELAKRTYNPKLGIEGGISILGTSGVVEPMSEKAVIGTIRLEIDSLYASGERRLLLCPGEYGTEFARDVLKLEISKSVKCSNYIGEALDHAGYRGFKDILLVGHAGKLVKLAAGIMNTHSMVADGRREIVAAHAAICGASKETLEKIMGAVSIDAMVEVLENERLREAVFSSIGKAIGEQLATRLSGRAEANFIMFTKKYGILCRSENWII